MFSIPLQIKEKHLNTELYENKVPLHAFSFK